MIRRLAPFLALIVMGAAWGATQPLAKVAVSEGYRHFGLVFWQAALVGVLLGAVTLMRGKRVPVTRRALGFYTVIALLGSVIPGIASFQAAVHLQSGVLSILLSSVPMFALPIALAIGQDRFSPGRLIGLLIGFAGVALLVLPEAGLPAGTSAFWVGVALIASLCYAMEGNFVGKFGTGGLDPVQLLAGASGVGVILSLPLALASGQFIAPPWPLEAPDLALLASAVLHAGAYSGYVALVGMAGSVFAAQVSYFVTLFGVTWAILFLGEGYSGWFWTALALLLAGLALVQPRPKALVTPAPLRQTTIG